MDQSGVPGAPGGQAPVGPTPVAQPQAPAVQQVSTIKSYGINGPQTQSASTTPSFDFTRQAADANKALQGFKEVSSNLNDLTGTLKDALKQLTEGSASMARGFKDARGTLSDLVDELDDGAATLKNINNLNSQLGRSGLFDGKSRDEILRFVGQVQKGTKEAMGSMSSPSARKALKEIADAYDDIKKKVEDVEEVNEDLWDSVEDLSRKAARNASKAAEDMKTSWTKSAQDIRKELQDMGKSVMADFKKYDKHGLFGNLLTMGKALRLGMQSLAPQVGAKAGNKSRQIQADKQARQQHLTDNWQAIATASRLKRGGVAALQYAKIMGDHKADPAFRKALKARTSSAAARPATESVPSEGNISLGTPPRSHKWLKRVMAEASSGAAGPSAEALQAAAGGGSRFKGKLLGGLSSVLNVAEMGGNVLGKAGGALGSMGGAIGGLASRAAVPLAIAKAAMDIWDKTAEINKTVENPAAKIGAFSGPDGVSGGFGSMRALVGSTGDQISLGLTWEKNAELLKKAVESGMTIGDEHLSKALSGEHPGVPAWENTYLKDQMNSFTKNGTGTALGAAWFGSTRGARGVGLSQEEGMELSIKLMQQYQQSAGESVEFYTKVSKGAKAAGLSTSKYISIVEGLSNKFEGFGNALGQTEFMLATLSKTGKYTGEQLKSMLDNLGDTKGMSRDMKAFLYTEMGSEGMGKMADVQKGEIDYTNKAFSEQLQGLSTPEGQKLAAEFAKLGPLSGIKSSYASAIVGQSGVSEDDKKNLQGLIERSKGAVGMHSLIKAGPIALATAGDAVGEDYYTSALSKLGGYSTVLKSKFGISTSDFADNPAVAFGKAGSRGMAASMFMKDLMGGQEGINMLPKILQSAGQALATSDLSGDSNADLRDRMAKDLRRAGHKEYTSGDDILSVDKKKLASDLAGIPDSLGVLISQNQGAKKNMDLLRKAEEAKAQEEKMRHIESETKTSADVFARSFEYLFFELMKPLGTIRDILTDWFGASTEGKDVKKSQDWFKTTFTSQTVDGMEYAMQEAFKKMQKNIDDKKETYNQMKEDDPKKAALGEEIKKLEADKEDRVRRGRLYMKGLRRTAADGIKTPEEGERIQGDYENILGLENLPSWWQHTTIKDGSATSYNPQKAAEDAKLTTSPTGQAAKSLAELGPRSVTRGGSLYQKTPDEVNKDWGTIYSNIAAEKDPAKRSALIAAAFDSVAGGVVNPIREGDKGAVQELWGPSGDVPKWFIDNIQKAGFAGYSDGGWLGQRNLTFPTTPGVTINNFTADVQRYRQTLEDPQSYPPNRAGETASTPTPAPQPGH